MKYTHIDTHTHLNLSAFKEDLEEVLKRTREAGVAHINVGTKDTTSKKAVEIAEANDGAWAIVGLHPIQTTPGHHDEETVGENGQPFTAKGEEFDTEFYCELAKSDKVVGIGECGFDYFHCGPETYEIQERAFIKQIELANELGLPLMIHTRDPKPGGVSPTGRSVYEDVYETLKKYAKVPGNVHFYAGTYEQAKKLFELGFTVSFTGVITFAKVYEEVVRAVPLDLMHAETDSPYVAPVPHRGKRCEPMYVKEVVEKIADIKNLPVEEVREQLLKNAEKLYGIK
ncbi:MAG: TatD family hydrolase [Candidatus Nomurabacteria bacterium]|nr:TatD family hydrolase [Candidatus Nomurabacteria bacterium]USN88199.1 MAG: TatD family hydrolase [Candidatus Nomurabacteria bacterium]